MYERVCPECGTTFTTNYSHKRFCADACRRKDENRRPTTKTCTCAHCGREYHPKASNRLKYCGRPCSYAATAAKKYCIDCGADLGARPGNRKLCSACKERRHQEAVIRERDANAIYMRRKQRFDKFGTDTPSVTCRHCGVTFTVAVTERMGVYCSDGCRQDATSRRLKGKAKTPRARAEFNVRKAMRTAIAGRCDSPGQFRHLGYTVRDLMAHLEAQFTEGMTWENYGVHGWHIDHVIPRVAFMYGTKHDAQFIVCWSLPNLRPLWAQDNIRKSDTLPSMSECPDELIRLLLKYDLDPWAPTAAAA